MQGLADQAVEGEVVLADADVALVDVAVGRLAEGHGMLGDGLRRVGRHAGDLDAQIGGHGDVHGVETGAAHQHEADAEALEDLERHGRHVGVDEGAHRVVAAGEGGGHGREVGLGEVDLDVGIVRQLLLEGLLVVARRAKEEDPHASCPFSRCVRAVRTCQYFSAAGGH